MDEATVQILLRAKQEGLDAIRDVRDALADLAQRAAITNAQLAAMNTATQAAQFSFLGMGQATWLLVGAIAAAALILSPFVALVTAAVVITTAFAVGVAAVSLSLLAAFGPLAALTAGVVLLADRMFTSGKTTVDPLLQIEQALGKVADAWGKLATPMANQFLLALMPMVPMIQLIGTQALLWFGQQMPVVIQITQFAAKALFDAIEQGGKIFNIFFQAMIVNRGTFEQFFNLLLQVGLQAVQGLLMNLLALSDWFLQRLPQMAPIVASIFGAIGSFIQGVGTVAGQVVDWFVKNWPQIAATANWTWQSIKAGWDVLAPVLQVALPAALDVIRQMLAYVAQHSQLVQALFILLGVAAAGVVLTLIAMATFLVGVITALIWLGNTIQTVSGWVVNLANGLWRVVDALAAIPGAANNARSSLSNIPVIGGIANALVPGFTGHSGGTVPGPVGAPVLSLLQGGERVLPIGGQGTDMQDTNNLLAAILMEIRSQRAGGLSTRAYASRA